MCEKNEELKQNLKTSCDKVKTLSDQISRVEGEKENLVNRLEDIENAYKKRLNELKANEIIAHEEYSSKQQKEIEFLKSKLEKVTDENRKREKTLKDMTRDIKNKDTQIKESLEKLKVLTGEKQSDKRHIEDLRKRVHDLEMCKTSILNQNANSIEIIDALQSRLDRFENLPTNELRQEPESYADKVRRKVPRQTSETNKIHTIAREVKVPQNDDIKTMIESLETRLLKIEKKNEEITDRSTRQHFERHSTSGNENGEHFKRKPCFKFRRTGYCRYGQYCKYRHDRDDNYYDKRNSEQESVLQSTSRGKVLLVGSSILKGINTNRLQNDVDVWTHRGATVLDIYNDLRFNIDVSKYSTVIVHVGGNDTDRRKDVRQFTSIYKDLIKFLKSKHCRVYVSEILPRLTCDVTFFNNRLYELCHDEDVSFISNVEVFADSENKLLKHLYWSDGVHLNNVGIVQFLKSIDKIVKLFKGDRRRVFHDGDDRSYSSNGY